MPTVGATVLIVDDDASARRLLQVRLRALGWEPVTAADGKDALEALRRDLPAAMLLDLEMPRMGGLELLGELQRSGVDVPTIVITAHGCIETAVEAMKSGAYHFMTKPFDNDEVLELVRSAIEQSRQAFAARSAQKHGDHSIVIGCQE